MHIDNLHVFARKQKVAVARASIANMRSVGALVTVGARSAMGFRDLVRWPPVFSPHKMAKNSLSVVTTLPFQRLEFLVLF